MRELSCRPSKLAGIWYPGRSSELAAQVDGFLEAAVPPTFTGRLIALIAPHAGYVYSGLTAGYAFRCVRGRTYPIAAVIAPFHAYHPINLISSAHTAYATPLGEVEVARSALDDFVSWMQANAGQDVEHLTNDLEHAVEIELPFLQRALAGKFKLLPLMISGGGLGLARSMGNALAEILRRKSALLVASSDLSHYLTKSRAEEMDHRMIGAILDLSPQSILDLQVSGRGYACGAVPVAVVVAAARSLGADSACLLNYSTSAAQSGDSSSVVGYAAIAIYQAAAE